MTTPLSDQSTRRLELIAKAIDAIEEATPPEDTGLRVHLLIIRAEIQSVYDRLNPKATALDLLKSFVLPVENGGPEWNADYLELFAEQARAVIKGEER